MRALIILTVTLGVLATACGQDSGGQPAATEPSGAQSEPAATRAGGQQEITGTFGGDAQLEGGCAWIDQGGKRWNVQYPQGYAVAFSPLRLTGPGGFTAQAGDTLTVTGKEAKDVVTACQIGPVFAASKVENGA